MPVENHDPRNILILTREHIGDLVCTTPAIQALRNRFPKSRIVVEVGERAAVVLIGNPDVNQIVIRSDHQGAAGRWKFVLEMRKQKFDLGVMLDCSTHMPLTLALCGVKHRVGLVRKRRFAKLLHQSVVYDWDIHEMIGNFGNVAALLGAKTEGLTPKLYPTSEDRSFTTNLLETVGLVKGDTVIGLNPGASAASNRWLPERFAELIDLLNGNELKGSHLKLLVLGGASDSEFVNRIEAQAKFKIIRLTGKLSVMQLAVALERCAVLVTADTGPMHIAAAVGTPIVALFGPAKPHESGPGYVNGNTVIRKVQECKFCTKSNCTQNQACMKQITAEEVYTAVVNKLGLTIALNTR